MKSKRTLIIGDVHGCLEELHLLLKKLAYVPRVDRLIFVGDLINKGPHSLGVLRWVEASGAEVVFGNHEMRFLELTDPEKPKNPRSTRSGLWNLIEEMGPSVKRWREWMKALPSYINEEDFCVVHAGVIPGVRVEETPERILCTIRTWDGKGEHLNQEGKDPAWYELYEDPKLIVFGHWALRGLIVRKNAIGLDSGCVYGRKLSALVLRDGAREREIVQVDALRAYQSIE